MRCMHACIALQINTCPGSSDHTLIEIFKFVNSIGVKTIGAKTRITGVHCFQEIPPRCLGRGRSWQQVRAGQGIP